MCFVAVVLYRMQAMQRAKEEGLLNHLKRGKKSKVKLRGMFHFSIHFVSSEAIAGMNSRGLLFFIPLVSLSYFFVTESLNCMVPRKVM